MESGPLTVTPGRQCPLCHAGLCDVVTTKISKGVAKVVHVDPIPGVEGTVAVSSTSNGYAGNVVDSKSKRTAMLAANVKLYTVHSEVCAKRGGSHRLT
jgi:hypothetical protein